MILNSYFNGILVGVLFGFLGFNLFSDIYLCFCLLLFLNCFALIFLFYYRQFIIFCFILNIGIISGISYSHINFQKNQTNLDIIDRYENLFLSYTGEVKEVYKKSDFTDEYIMVLESIGGRDIDAKIHYILRIPKNFTLHPGQRVGHNGKVYLLKDFDGFSYQKFMLSKSIYFSTSSNVVDIVENNTSGIMYYLYLFREKLLGDIGNIFPKNEAIFLGGILFGARENIPAELKEDFNNSGLTHFIAVSGFNITLCVIFTTFLFGFLPPWLRVIGVSVVIVSFSFFVGLGAPVVRAAIMGIIAYIFLQTGNNSKNITLLTFTAVCMGLWSPLSISYDVSLHLSFLAVIGIIYTQDIFQKIFFFIPSTFAIREAVILTFSALSFSLPIMIFQFGQVSLLAPLSNVAVTWTIPLAMLGGALTLIVYYISPFLGEFAGFLTWILLHYDMQMVHFFGNIERGLLKVDFGSYNFFGQILYFLVLIYVLVLYHLKGNKKQP